MKLTERGRETETWKRDKGRGKTAISEGRAQGEQGRVEERGKAPGQLQAKLDYYLLIQNIRPPLIQPQGHNSLLSCLLISKASV